MGALNHLRLAAFCIVAVLVCPPHSALADDPAVRCLQKQLGKLGYYGGVEDGAVNIELNKAFGDFNDGRASRQFDFELDSSKAIVACRELGMENYRLRAYWPSFRRRIATDFHSTLDTSVQDSLRELASDALDRLHEVFEVSLAETITILAATNKPDLRQIWMQHAGATSDASAFDRIYDLACSNGSIVGGFEFQGVLAICLPKGNIDLTVSLRQPDTQSARNRFTVKLLLFHEIFHAAQYQLLGRPGDGPASQLLQKWGPEWLVEGAAGYFAIRAGFNDGAAGPIYVKIRNEIGGPAGDLSKYESIHKYHASRTDIIELADQGGYAAFVLAGMAGDRSITEFYEKIGFGMHWKTAFLEAFGRSVEDFYRQYGSY